MDLKDLIARQRAKIEAPKSETVPVALGGELVEVEVLKLLPDAWQELVATHPPRKTARSDINMGYDQHALPRDYPASRVKVAGEDIDQATWAELWASLDSVNKKNVHAAMWGLNVYEAMQELQELGKAVAAQQSESPAN